VSHYNLRSKITLLSLKETSTCPPLNKTIIIFSNSPTYSSQNHNTRLTTHSPQSTTRSPITNRGKKPSTAQFHPRRLSAPHKTGTLNTGSIAQSTHSAPTLTDTNSGKSATTPSGTTTKPSTPDTSSICTKHTKCQQLTSTCSDWRPPRTYCKSRTAQWPMKKRSKSPTQQRGSEP